MTNSDSRAGLFQSEARQLAKIIGFEDSVSGDWTDADLAAILGHQMRASLKVDLGGMRIGRGEAGAREKALSLAASQGVESFEALIHHPNPQIELLKLSKAFFKQRTEVFPKGLPEWKIAYLFYTFSILAAGDRRPEVSSLGASDLLKGVKWALAQEWIDEKSKSLLMRFEKRLATAPAG